ncbi:MAG TPA: hypothetical protein VMG13_13340 [Trebonia sp.]|nr:hypothetical protein [Trebonia sp.]
MHDAISYELAKTRIAELRQRAQRDALACAARQARPRERGDAAPRWPLRRYRRGGRLRPSAAAVGEERS